MSHDRAPSGVWVPTPEEWKRLHAARWLRLTGRINETSVVQKPPPLRLPAVVKGV